ncbi:MAG TPA: tetratricopeptide repeat protein [Isosphaeraceae bacterium]|nr:tetratricopeptide repeat protein [Isosphaeraceae bacterium]
MRPCLIQGSFVLAGTFLCVGLAARGQELPFSTLTDWNHQNTMGWLALRRGDLQKAEKKFRAAIAIMTPYAKTEVRLLARSYHDLAFTLHEEGRFAAAEPLAKWALSVREQYDGASSTALAQNLNLLATIYVSQRRYSEAEPLYRESIPVWEQSLGAEHIATATAYEDLATVLTYQRKYEQAEPFFKRAQYLFGRGRPNFPKMVESLSALAANDVAQGRDAPAADLYKRAIKIYDDKSIPLEDPELATVLDQYASLLRKTHRDEDAEPLEARAKAIRERWSTAGPPPPRAPRIPAGAPTQAPPNSLVR